MARTHAIISTMAISEVRDYVFYSICSLLLVVFFFFLTVELIHFERFRDMKALPTEILCQDMTDEVSADTIQTFQSQSMTQSLGKRIKCAWRHM